MALLQAVRPQALRALHPGSCSLARGLTSSSSLSRAFKDNPHEDIQDPNKTHPAYAGGEKGMNRKPPGPEDEGVEREVKWGGNVPANAEQLKDELKGAAEGLADSVKMGAQVLAHKAREKVEGVKRVVGLEAQPEMSQDTTMGAAGKMEKAPPGSKTGGPAASREHARATYDEISRTEKPHWEGGERDVTEKYPDMAQVAKTQSATPEEQRAANEQLEREMRSPGSMGQTAASSQGRAGSAGRSQDPGRAALDDTMHGTGP